MYKNEIENIIFLKNWSRTKQKTNFNQSESEFTEASQKPVLV